MQRNAGLMRPLAVALMILGAVGFAAARVWFGEQVVCMFGSTLVVFLGLGLIFYARRSGGAAPQTGSRQRVLESVDVPDSEAVEPGQHPLASLMDFVANVFQRQGANVTVETYRPERSILVVTLPGGERAIAIVQEGMDAVDVTELRALMALVSNHNGQMGYYVTDGYFTPAATAWAAGKPLRLVEKGQLEMLAIS